MKLDKIVYCPADRDSQIHDPHSIPTIDQSSMATGKIKEEKQDEDRTAEEEAEEIEDPFLGHELYNYFGNRVIESKTTGGNVVAVKIKPRAIQKAIRRESRMVKHVSEQPNLQVPRYRVGERHIVIVTDLVQGTS